MEIVNLADRIAATTRIAEELNVTLDTVVGGKQEYAIGMYYSQQIA